MAVGGGRKFVTAVVVIYEENVSKFAERNSIRFFTYADLSQNKKIYELINQEVGKVNEKLAHSSHIKEFAPID